MYNSSEFVLTFPCYSIISATTHTAVAMSLDDGTACVVLTDDDLLTRFRKGQNFLGPTLRFDHAAELLLYLKYLPQHFTLIAIDPGPISTIAVPISEFTSRCFAELRKY